MESISRRARRAAIAISFAALAAACTSSSPVDIESQAEIAGGSVKFQVSPLIVAFGTAGTTASVTLTNSTPRTLSWTASENAGWLTLGAKSGSIAGRSSKTVSLSAQRGRRAAGTYTTNVTVSAGSAGSAVVSVSMAVASTSTSGQLSVSPLQVDFGTTATTASVTLKNTGSTSLSWTATESAGWLALGATSGSIAANSSKALSLSAQRTGMSTGTYTTSVSIAAGAAGSVTESVMMTVPTSSSSSSVQLAGQLIDQFDGHALAGLTVQYNGATTTTDASGRFTLPGSATSTLKQLTLSGSGVYRRLTYARTGDNLWRVLPSAFAMTAFDDVAREEFGTSTVRWVAPPTVYVDTRPEAFTGGTELQTWISEVRVQAAEFVSKWTDTTISPASVIVTSTPPKDYSAGTIVIHFSEDPSRYGGSSSTIGYARLTWLSDRSIYGSAVWLRYVRYSGTGYASKRRGILGHELGHAMGLGHMNGATLSLMASSIGSKTDLSAFDDQVASLLYRRWPGNTSPDTDSSSGYRGLLAPAGLPVANEWMCGAADGLSPRDD